MFTPSTSRSHRNRPTVFDEKPQPPEDWGQVTCFGGRSFFIGRNFQNSSGEKVWIKQCSCQSDGSTYSLYSPLESTKLMEMQLCWLLFMTYSSEWFPIAPILEGACDVLSGFAPWTQSYTFVWSWLWMAYVYSISSNAHRPRNIVVNKINIQHQEKMFLFGNPSQTAAVYIASI